MQEKSLHLGVDGERIFAVLHEPVASNGRGVVVCAPLGEEMLWSRRVLVTFARELADSGHAVLRFDYRGEGDSDRWFQDTSVSTRLEDTALAVQSLRSLAPEVDDVTLVGLRFGATIAAAAGAAATDVHRMVLWDPVVDGSEYMQSVLRLNLMYQMALHGKVVENREQLAARLMDGGTVNIEGYELGSSFFEEACSLQLSQALGHFAGPVHIVSVVPRAGAPTPALEALAVNTPRVTLSSVVEEPFWREIRTFYQRADNLFDTTVRWLGDQS